METFRYKINSEYGEVSKLMENIISDGLYSAIDDSLKGEIEICLVEALNNVIRHSYKEESGNVIDLIITKYDSIITIQINEYGLPRPENVEPQLEFDPEDIDNLPEGGMGLFIIENLMDETEYHSDGTTNTFTMVKNIS